MNKDEVVWITGASSGIGEALAKGLAARGCRLILSGRNMAELERVNAVCGGGHFILPFDTTDYDALPEMVEQARFKWGRIDMLINNAGISQRSLAIKTDLSVYRQIVEIDLMAPIALTQAVLPVMAAQGSGRIAMMASVAGLAGLAGVPLRTAYCAAKHGIVGYAESLRSEVARLGVQVHVIAPGSVRTNVSKNSLRADGLPRGESDTAIENGIDPDEAAATMIDAMAVGQREIIVAEGMEAALTAMRRSDPDALFDQMEAMMAAGYAAKMGAE